MNREKFRFIQQKRSVLKTLMKQEHPDITQAGIGDDYSRLVLSGKQNGGIGDDDSRFALPERQNGGIGDDDSRLVLSGKQNGGNEMLGVTEGLCLENALGYVTSDVIKQYNKLCLLYTSPSPRDA